MDVVTDNTQRILGALENPKYQWRTLEGLAAETGVAPDELNQVLAGALSDQGCDNT
jgi:hypothetical protein